MCSGWNMHWGSQGYGILSLSLVRSLILGKVVFCFFETQLPHLSNNMIIKVELMAVVRIKNIRIYKVFKKFLSTY